jgi:hypothetical protein
LALGLVAGSVAAPSRQRNLSEEAIAFAAADALGIRLDDVYRTSRALKVPLADAVPVLYLTRVSGRDPKTIWKSRSNGNAWGKIALDLGIHPAVFNRQRRDSSTFSDRDFEDQIWRELARAAGLRLSDIDKGRRTGAPWDEVFYAGHQSRDGYRTMDDWVRSRTNLNLRTGRGQDFWNRDPWGDYSRDSIIKQYPWYRNGKDTRKPDDMKRPGNGGYPPIEANPDRGKGPGSSGGAGKGGGGKGPGG